MPGMGDPRTFFISTPGIAMRVILDHRLADTWVTALWWPFVRSVWSLWLAYALQQVHTVPPIPAHPLQGLPETALGRL